MYTSTSNIPTPKPVHGRVGTVAKMYGSAESYAIIDGKPVVSFQQAVSSSLASPILQTLKPIADLLTIVQSPYFWLNTGGLVVGVVLTVLALYVIMQSEITGVKRK